jgi:hypothetical protein
MNKYLKEENTMGTRTVKRNKMRAEKAKKKKVIDREDMLAPGDDINSLPTVAAEDLDGTWEDVDKDFLDMLSDMDVQKAYMEKMAKMDSADSDVSDELGGASVTITHLKEKTEEYRKSTLEKIDGKTGPVDVDDPDEFLLYMEINQGLTDIGEEYGHLISTTYVDLVPKITSDEEVLTKLTDLEEISKTEGDDNE